MSSVDYRVAVVLQDRVTFAPGGQTWTEETVRAESEAAAVAEALRRHAVNPRERCAIGGVVIGHSVVEHDA